MKKMKWCRIVSWMLTVCMALTMLCTTAFATTEYEDTDEDALNASTSMYSSTSYQAYISSMIALLREKGTTKTEAEILESLKGQGLISVDLSDYTVDTKATKDALYINGVSLKDNTTTLNGYGDALAALEGDTTGLYTMYVPESGTVTFNVNVPNAGFYGIKIEYYPLSIDGKISSPEKKLLVDEELLFSECTSLSFEKRWVYSFEYTENEQGNYIKVQIGVDANNEPVYSFMLPEEATKLGKTSVDNKKYSRAYTKDINGNDTRCDCNQVPTWLTYTLSDAEGFVDGDLQIYFEAGEHQLSLIGSREGLLIKSIELFPVEGTMSYAKYLEENNNKPNDSANGKIVFFEAEYPDAVSDSSVYASNDRSSAITSPSDAAAQLLNVIGKESYATVGQWASYKFTVSEDGYYHIAARYKQEALEGMFSSRALKLSSTDGVYGAEDGTPTLPFAEAARMRFNYSKKWQSSYLGYYETIEKTNNGKTEVENIFHDFTFYFKKGVVYTMQMEVSLGDMAEVINTVENSLSIINSCYLNILRLTGASPDEYRSYNFMRVMPNTVRALAEQAKVLESVVEKMKNITGASGSNTATLKTIAILLDKMGNDEYEIAGNLDNLKSYIGNLGTWLNTAKEQRVTIDFFQVQPVAEKKLPKANANVFQSIWFEIRAFFSSFTTDYNSMGISETTEKIAEIDVWLAYGRDQSQIWRNLIDAQFTSDTSVAVTLKLVTAGTLLPSVLCGEGPDVYIGLASADTINYAIRSATLSLNTYNNIDNELRNTIINKRNNSANAEKYMQSLDYVKGFFTDSSLVPLSLYGETYGIPETTAFNMMFVRSDILESLDIDVPETWDDILAAIPILQSNNMMIGINYATAYNIFLYQRNAGIWLYNGTDGYELDGEYAGAQIGFSTNTALDAFADVCRLYTDYSFPVTYDGPNRFRTGEMPILIADYVATYNQLTVFATEIAGMWQFSMVPGTVNLVYNADGTPALDIDGNQKTEINHSSITSVTATVLMHKENRSAEESIYAWEFMVWQCGAEAQAEYGNRMVALIGPSAKYATANVEAIKNLSWTSSELSNIELQLNHLAAIENYPGSYYVARNVTFAFYDCYNEGKDAADALKSYVNAINKELSRKREEFDLKVLEIGQTPEEARAEEKNENK